MNNLTESLPAGSIGRDVNDLGQVVGRGPSWTPMIWLLEPAYGLPRGVTQFPLATMFSPEVLAQYGFLGVINAEFFGINNSGQAVGDVLFAVMLPDGDIGATLRGFVWRDAQFFLTQQFLSPDSEFVFIIRTDGVNDAGQIVATGVNQRDESLGLILTPVSPLPVQ